MICCSDCVLPGAMGLKKKVACNKKTCWSGKSGNSFVDPRLFIGFDVSGIVSNESNTNREME